MGIRKKCIKKRYKGVGENATLWRGMKIGINIYIYLIKFINYGLKSALLRQIVLSTTSGRNKRNSPLPIFKNEPIGRINEYTYYSAMEKWSGSWWLPKEINKKGRAIFDPQRDGLVYCFLKNRRPTLPGDSNPSESIFRKATMSGYGSTSLTLSVVQWLGAGHSLI